MRLFRQILFALLSVCCLLACKQEGVEEQYAEVKLVALEDSPVGLMTKGTFPVIPDSYSVEIYQDGNLSLNGNYGELKDPFILPVGDGYRVVAQNMDEGEALSSRGGRGDLWIRGESDEFLLNPMDHKDITFTCTVSNARVSVAYTEDFLTMYTAATVKVYETSAPSRAFTFTRGSTHSDTEQYLYFNIDSNPQITVVVDGTLYDGSKNSFTQTFAISPAQWLKLTIHSNYMTGKGDMNISYESDMLSETVKVVADPNTQLVLTMPTQPASNVYAKYFFPVLLSESNITGTDNKDIVLRDMVYEISADGTNWTSMQSVKGRNVFNNLTPGRSYQYRARYYNITSSPVVITTEAAQQVGNAGFEEWTSGTRYDQPIYYPWSSGTSDKWWDMNSFETMPKKYSAYEDYKCFPTCYFTSDKYSGYYAAQIRPVAVNGWNSEAMGAGPKQAKLFIGSSGDGSSQGHSFSSRPSKIIFWYKYDRYSSDTFSATVKLFSGSTQIAAGSFSGSDDTESSWKKAEIELNYTSTSLIATDIQIMFLASTASEPPTRKITVTIPAGERKIYGGSCLTLDDIELIYESY